MDEAEIPPLKKGAMYNSFEDLAVAIKIYSEETKTQFVTGISKSVAKANASVREGRRLYSERFKYSHITYTCRHYGKVRRTGAGVRAVQRSLKIDCPVKVMVQAHRNLDCMIVSLFVTNHNHDLPGIFKVHPEMKMVNWTNEEVSTLVLQMQVHYPILIGNNEDMTPCPSETRDAIWQQITEEVGRIGYRKRDSEQVKNKWFSLVADTLAKESSIQQYMERKKVTTCPMILTASEEIALLIIREGTIKGVEAAALSTGLPYLMQQRSTLAGNDHSLSREGEGNSVEVPLEASPIQEDSAPQEEVIFTPPRKRRKRQEPPTSTPATQSTQPGPSNAAMNKIARGVDHIGTMLERLLEVQQQRLQIEQLRAQKEGLISIIQED